MLPNIGGDPKPKLLDWPLIAGLPNPAVVVAPNAVVVVAPNPEFATPKPVFEVLEIHTILNCLEIKCKIYNHQLFTWLLTVRIQVFG